MNKELQERVIKDTEEKIKKLLDDGIQSNNLMLLGQLIDIQKDMKKIGGDSMYGEYGNYGGRRPGYDSYGEYGNYGEYGRGNYGRRGRDMKYRGDEELDRMSGEYGRYMENRNRYGAGEETDKSFHYMVKALEDFIRVLHEEADTPGQKQMLNETLQKSMR